jgi:uncharacterized protein DUF397
MHTPRELRWWKSSRSSSQGGSCVEVAVADGLPWRTSSRSTSQGGQCVEVAGAGSTWYVRDSKDPQGPVLAVNGRAWSVFTETLRIGHLDHA